MPQCLHIPHESNWTMLLAHSSSCFSSLPLKYQHPSPHPLPPPVWSCGSASSVLPHSPNPLNTVSSGAACKTGQHSTLGTMAQWCSLTLATLRPMNTYFPHLVSSLPEGGDWAHRPCLRFRGRPGPLLARVLFLSSCCSWSCCCCSCCFSLTLQQSQHDMIMLIFRILIPIIYE